MKYNTLTISKPEELIFGKSVYPVKTRRGLEIGGGLVYPELNFTLPQMQVSIETMSDVKRHYEEILKGSIEKAMHLYSEGVVFEFEMLIEMTKNPAIGIEVLKLMEEGHKQIDVASVLGISRGYVSKVVKSATKDGLLSAKGKLTQTGWKYVHRDQNEETF